MSELLKIRDGVTKLFTSGTDSTEVTPAQYRSFCYPKTVKLMRFEVKQYRVKGFGGFMTMYTDTAFGMQLLTSAFMPYECADVPFLLIDIMTMKKKRLGFVEYYDCTEGKPEQPLLSAVHEKYCGLPEYSEKPAWYIGERSDYSLIKSLDPNGDRRLSAELTADSVRAYKKAAFSAEKHAANLDGLLAFRTRMINEGNPSSATLKKVFGEKGAEEFFVRCVMPDGEN